jgi:hypothetical protein
MRLSRVQFEALFDGPDWRRVLVQRVQASACCGWMIYRIDLGSVLLGFLFGIG